MSLIALDPRATREYSLCSDAGEDKTIWIIGQLDPFIMANIKDRLAKYALNDKGQDELATIVINKNELDLDIVRIGLKGWRNFRHQDGTDVDFKTESRGFKGLGPRVVVSEQCMKCLHPSWITELAKEICADNTLMPDEEKNSAGPSR